MVDDQDPKLVIDARSDANALVKESSEADRPAFWIFGPNEEFVRLPTKNKPKKSSTLLVSVRSSI